MSGTMETNANDQHQQQLQQQQQQLEETTPTAETTQLMQQQQQQHTQYNGADHIELKDGKLVLTSGALPNGVRMDTTAPVDSVYAHLSADGTVQRMIAPGTGVATIPGAQVPTSLFHGTWPFVGAQVPVPRHLKGVPGPEQETASVMSFSSSACSGGGVRRPQQNNQLGTKVSK